MPAEWLEPSAPLPGVGVSLDRLVVYRGSAAGLPPAAGFPSGVLAQLTNLRNSWWTADGTDWRPAGRQVIFLKSGTNNAPGAFQYNNTGVANETQVITSEQWYLPPRVLAVGNEFVYRILIRRSGTTSTFEAGALHIRATNVPYSSENDVGGVTTSSGGSSIAAATQVQPLNASIVIGPPNESTVRQGWLTEWSGNTSAASLAQLNGFDFTVSGMMLAPRIRKNGTDPIWCIRHSLEVM